jgi:ElaB/YqjD/DUF883 family membrane-anchored ribosome-binding protein
LDTEIQKYILEIKDELNQVIDNLDNIDDVFKEKIDKIDLFSDDIKKKREYLLNNYKKEDLEIFNNEIDILIKQIVEKFDSIIKSKQKTQKEIKVELKKTLNQKKLVNYK